MSTDNYMESRGRNLRRKGLRIGTPLLGAALGAAVPKHRALGALLGAGVGELSARRMQKMLDKRDLRKAGFVPHASSMIRGSRYAPEGAYVKFNTGNVYRYGGVSRDELARLAEAESVGAHFNQNLRHRKYEKIGKL